MNTFEFKTLSTVNKRRILIIAGNSARFTNESGLILNSQLTALGFEIVITVLVKYSAITITIKDRT